MENIEMIQEQVVEQVAEQPTEKPVKTYTQEEVNEIVGRRNARTEAKLRKEYDREYGELLEVLRTGTGKQEISDIKKTFQSFYEEKGVKFDQKPTYSEKDMKVLARAEAEEIINSGLEDVIEEVERLAAVGIQNMSPREKEVFRNLAEHRQKAERSNEFGKLGIAADVYSSKDFQSFVGMFSPNTPVKDIYEVYQKTIPKKEIKPMGSMQTTAPQDNGVKDFYTFEEASKFTKKDLDKNPALYKKIQESMTKW